eukprot:12667925-Alexandrium_andersonii.AAC.1
MSASLVGSEMCIRDSPCPPRCLRRWTVSRPSPRCGRSAKWGRGARCWGPTGARFPRSSPAAAGRAS